MVGAGGVRERSGSLSNGGACLSAVLPGGSGHEVNVRDSDSLSNSVSRALNTFFSCLGVIIY